MLHPLLKGKKAVKKTTKVRITVRVNPEFSTVFWKFLKEQKKAGGYSSLSEPFEELVLKIIKTKGHKNV
jgi:hypothetical protein